MVDETTAGDQPAARCPWCSAELSVADAERCPSCGAQLVGGNEASVPGLTAVDAAAIVRSKQAIRPRSRLLSWLSGDDPDEVYTKADGQALAPPDVEVRREILRLELEAEVANLQAENDAALAEAVAEGRVVEVPEVDPDSLLPEAAEEIRETEIAEAAAEDGATAVTDAVVEGAPATEAETAPETRPETEPPA